MISTTHLVRALTLLAIAQQGIIAWLGYTTWTLTPGRKPGGDPPAMDPLTALNQAPEAIARAARGGPADQTPARGRYPVVFGTFEEADADTITVSSGPTTRIFTRHPDLELPEGLRPGVDLVELRTVVSTDGGFTAFHLRYTLELLEGFVLERTPQALVVASKLHTESFQIDERWDPIPDGIGLGAWIEVAYLRDEKGRPQLLDVWEPGLDELVDSSPTGP
jgi:hypothetical protein